MTRVGDVVAAVEQLGATLWLDGDEVKIRYPKERLTAITPLLAKLRDVRAAVADLVRSRHPAQTEFPWPQQSLACERKFGHPSTRLYPFIGSLVTTPKGTGELVQVFKSRASVVLDCELTKPKGERKMTFFPPSQVFPRQLV